MKTDSVEKMELRKQICTPKQKINKREISTSIERRQTRAKSKPMRLLDLGIFFTSISLGPYKCDFEYQTVIIRLIFQNQAQRLMESHK